MLKALSEVPPNLSLTVMCGTLQCHADMSINILACQGMGIWGRRCSTGVGQSKVNSLRIPSTVESASRPPSTTASY